MKHKLSFTIVLTFLLSVAGFSQQGSSAINLHAGIGGNYQGYKAQTPSFFASYEYFVLDNVSVGAMGGYATLTVPTYDWGGVGETTDKYSNIIASGIANYYFVNGDTFDVYSGIKIGYASEYAANIFYSVNLGAKYFFSESMAISAEGGIGIPILKVGVTFNL